MQGELREECKCSIGWAGVGGVRGRSSSQWVVSGFVGLVPVCGNINAQDAITGPVTVSVDFAKEQKNFLAPRTIGVQAAYYDTAMLKPESVDQLKAAGILTLHYPSGRVSDDSHWMTYNKYDGRQPVDFGSFVKFADKIGGTMVLTVNYGSNLKNDGPGEPMEAAAWVAYANGQSSDTRVIGT